MNTKNIEQFFLTTLLQIAIVGVFLMLISTVWFSPENHLAIYISSAVCIAGIISYFLRNSYANASVIIITSVALITVSYQRYMVPNTSTSLAIVLIIGFVYSVMLKGKIMWLMHAFAFILINTVFVVHVDEPLRACVIYSTLYFIIAYATAILKYNYDKIHHYLTETNLELNEKAKEIEAQNEELLQIQDNLNSVNNELESIVAERTRKITTQNEILLKYSYANAHHLRGPVARMLGLANVYKLETNPEPNFFIEKMLEEAIEIDLVVKKINLDLDSNPEDSNFMDGS